MHRYACARGKLFVISAPSGAGKSTLCSMMVEKYPELRYSVSYTTRNPRGEEKNGVDYHFITENEFRQKISEGEFLEWANVHGNYYGTSAKEVSRSLAGGTDIILDIDPQGAMQLKEKMENGVYIFITAPSMDELRRRLMKRGTDAERNIELRMKNARREVEYFADYDYLIINDSSADAFLDLEAVYRAEKLRTRYITEPEDFMAL